MKVFLAFLISITVAGCASVTPDRTADCGAPPQDVASDIAAAVRKEWRSASSRKLAIVEPQRAMWVHNFKAPEYGYVVVVGLIEGNDAFDLGHGAYGVFFKRGSLVMIHRLFMPTLTVTFLDGEEGTHKVEVVKPNESPEATPGHRSPVAPSPSSGEPQL